MNITKVLQIETPKMKEQSRKKTVFTILIQCMWIFSLLLWLFNGSCPHARLVTSSDIFSKVGVVRWRPNWFSFWVLRFSFSFVVFFFRVEPCSSFYCHELSLILFVLYIICIFLKKTSSLLIASFTKNVAFKRYNCFHTKVNTNKSYLHCLALRDRSYLNGLQRKWMLFSNLRECRETITKQNS